ncbi:MAG: CBS domain-containing protein [Candidatus Aenigmarchaeota archaeon]|nr:CBS domain-containing protein [Candidatus Aenigmarchaeota archaeon]
MVNIKIGLISMKLDVLVKDVMKRNIKTIKDTDSVKKAASLMKKYNIGSVIVLDKKKNMVGILTKADIVYKFVAEGKKSVKSVMTKKYKKISPRKTIEDASSIMIKNKIEKLPVFEKNRLVGIISVTDILRVEPGLFTVFAENLKLKGPVLSNGDSIFGNCESCGNYSDDLREVNGMWLCPDCR